MRRHRGASIERWTGDHSLQHPQNKSLTGKEVKSSYRKTRFDEQLVTSLYKDDKLK